MNICNVTDQIATRAPLPGSTGLKWPRLSNMLQISPLLAAFIGYLAIALALPLEKTISHAFIRSMYTAEVPIRPQLTY